METNEALRIVESVLNEYRGIKRLSEILEPVMQAEIRLSELTQKIENIEKEIADAEAAKVKAVADAEDVKAAAFKDAAADAKIRSAQRSKWAEQLKKAEEDHVAASARVSIAEAEYEAVVAKMGEEVAELKFKADAEQVRLEQIEAKIAELKGM